MMCRAICGVALAIAAVLPVHAAGLSLVGLGGATVGSAKINLAKGSVTIKTTGLGTLPASVDPGTGAFDAYLYKAYLTSTTDPAVEIFVGDVWPNTKGKAAVKAKLKGNLEGLGFDQVLIVAFSKDATQSADVATAALQ